MLTLKQMKKYDKNKKEKTYSVLQNMFYVVQGIFQRQRVLFFMMIINAIITGLTAYFPSIMMKFVIMDLQQQVNVEVLIHHVVLLCGIIFISMLTIICIESQTWWRLIDCRVFFMMKRVHKVLHMDYQYLESSEVMEICHRAKNATKGNNNGVEGMMHSFSTILILLTKFFYGIIILAFLSPRLVICNILLGLIVLFHLNYTKKINKKKVWDTLDAFWQKLYYMQHISTHFSYAKDLRLYNMREWILRKYEKIHLLMHVKGKEANRNWMFSNILGSTIFLVLNIIIHSYLVRYVMYGGMSIDDYIFYLGTATTFYITMFGTFNKLTDLVNQSREVSDFRKFLEFPDEIKKVEAQPIPKTNAYEFVFEQVSFCYPNAEQYAIKNLNLTIKAGEKLAIVGLNGAGKTTMIKLLCRIYTPTSGRILLNGIDIQSFDRQEYFMLFAPMFQNIEMFAFSIETNVSMDTDTQTDTTRVFECLRMAGLEEKIRNLSNGTKTQLLKILDEEGIDLSGGERQKLAFARALYKDAPVLVLDEPTSALDAMAEHELYQKFNYLIGEKTAIFISHRLSSTKFCDKIAMFENGNLVEYGNHDSLLKQSGNYAQMYYVQAKYYQKEGVIRNE